MKNWIFTILLIAIICLLLFNKPKQTDYSNKLDSLQVEISSIKNKRDSVKLRIDTTVIKIKENEKYYKETVNTIINNTTDDNYVFFVNYLKENRERYDSIYNSDSIKAN